MKKMWRECIAQIFFSENPREREKLKGGIGVSDREQSARVRSTAPLGFEAAQKMLPGYRQVA